MRAKRAHQRSLFDAGYPDHQMGRGLAAISEVLDQHPEFVEWIAQDVDRGGRSSMGRAGLPCEVILRCGILKHLWQSDYRELEFVLADSASARRFTRIDPLRPPKRSALRAASEPCGRRPGSGSTGPCWARPSADPKHRSPCGLRLAGLHPQARPAVNSSRSPVSFSTSSIRSAIRASLLSISALRNATWFRSSTTFDLSCRSSPPALPAFSRAPADAALLALAASERSVSDPVASASPCPARIWAFTRGIVLLLTPARAAAASLDKGDTVSPLSFAAGR